MTGTSDELHVLLRRGPAILFLGQDYLRLETGTDSLLTQVLRKYGSSDADRPSYEDMLDGGVHDSIESALAWMQGRSQVLSVPDWLKTVAGFAWSGLYTSAIDVLWPRAFRREWRELHPLFEEKYRPIDPRNRSRLHCTALFGNVGRSERAERPPLDRLEWLRRKQSAVALARRLPEDVTPFGVLVVEGYGGIWDWLAPDDLWPVLDELNPGQAHMFSMTENLSAHPLLAELVDRGKLVPHAESLASYLLRAQEAGFLEVGLGPVTDEHGRRIQLEKKTLVVPTAIWNQISRSATVLDDTVLTPPPRVSEAVLYRNFRTFLSESGARPLWSAYSRGFAFARDFETDLLGEVAARLRAPDLHDEPVVVHGPTGTGKTVALGSLAYSVRKDRAHPVIFIERRSQRPQASDIDAFCQWAEDSGAPATLIVWDGMVEVDQYFGLVKYLAGRGRKVVLVGSSYRIEAEGLERGCFVEAPDALSRSEIAALKNLLEGFEPVLGELVDEQLAAKDATCLVALYRLLPATRGQLRAGVTTEIGLAEQDIARKARELVPTFKPGYALAHALVAAGLISGEHVLAVEEKLVGDEMVSQPQELVGLVMVPGRFGLRVPIELLLRTLGREAFSAVSAAFLLSDLDILRWHEDSSGNIAVAPRHPLEAKLFTQARFGGPRTEVALARKLLMEIHHTLDTLDGSEVEIQFAVDLVRSMGPNGQDQYYFALHYRELAEALRELREKRGVQNPRLMLQEANLLREWLVKQAQAGKPCEDGEDVLQQAETVLSQALDQLGTEASTRQLSSSLLIELSSVLATRVRHLLDRTERPEDFISFYEQARMHLFKARAMDPEDYHSVDVFAWMTRDVLQAGLLDPQARAEAEADLLHVFDMAEVERFDILQQELFHKRRMEIGQLLGNQQMSDEAFESLTAQGSKAGYYLRAARMAGDLSMDADLTTTQRQNCSQAAEYLAQHRQTIAGDGRCLYLLLKLWWVSHTGRPLFYEERQTVAFDENQWDHCLGIILELLDADPRYSSASLKYLCGLASFHAGRIEDAFQVFRELERESHLVRGRRRIIRHYVASTSEGKPRTFDGTVAWVSASGNKGEVWVEELRRHVAFIPGNFRAPNIQKHETLPGFHLAFNFLGPIADPPQYLRSNQKDPA